MASLLPLVFYPDDDGTLMLQGKKPTAASSRRQAVQHCCNKLPAVERAARTPHAEPNQSQNGPENLRRDYVCMGMFVLTDCYNGKTGLSVDARDLQRPRTHVAAFGLSRKLARNWPKTPWPWCGRKRDL